MKGGVSGLLELISEAPGELLDERQIALRDANYSLAYSSLVPLIYAYGALPAPVTADGWLHDYINGGFWMGIALSYILSGASPPAMLLAWSRPSEPDDEHFEQLANNLF